MNIKSHSNIKRNKLEQYVKVYNKIRDESIKRLDELHRQSALINTLHNKTNINISSISSNELELKEKEVLKEKEILKEKSDNYLLNETELVISSGSGFLSINGIINKSENEILKEREISNSMKTNSDFLTLKYIHKPKKHINRDDDSDCEYIKGENERTDEQCRNQNNKIYNLFIHYIQRNKIKHIVNVYQEKYSNKSASGLGDFIRGCYFIIQFCNYIKKNNNITLKPEFIINHKISNFLLNDIESVVNTSNIISFDKVNWLTTEFNFDGTFKDILDTDLTTFMNYVMHSSIIERKTGKLYIYTVSFPINEKTISIHEKRIIKLLLEPNVFMKNYISNIMHQYSLSEKKYNVLHIRSGDKYLFGDSNTFDNNYLNKLETIINDATHKWNTSKENQKNKSNKILLVADNNHIKDYLIHLYPNIISFKQTIGHFGEGQIQNEDNIKNTLLDFYLLSMSSFIISVTSYSHGSGFSKWCAFTYDIPYLCYYC